MDYVKSLIECQMRSDRRLRAFVGRMRISRASGYGKYKLAVWERTHFFMLKSFVWANRRYVHAELVRMCVCSERDGRRYVANQLAA